MKSKEEILKEKGFVVTVHEDEIGLVTTAFIKPLFEAMEEYASQFKQGGQDSGQEQQPVAEDESYQAFLKANIQTGNCRQAWGKAIEWYKSYTPQVCQVPSDEEIEKELNNSHTIKTDEDEESEYYLTYWYDEDGKRQVKNFIRWLKSQIKTVDVREELLRFKIWENIFIDKMPTENDDPLPTVEYILDQYFEYLKQRDNE